MIEGKRILVAEDDMSMVEMYKDFFRVHKLTKGGNFIYTYSTKTTLEALNNDKFDSLLLDLGLEDVSPPPGLKIIKEYSKKIPTKIVVVSAYTEFKDECMSLGAFEFVKKPIVMSAIVEALVRSL